MLSKKDITQIRGIMVETLNEVVLPSIQNNSQAIQELQTITAKNTHSIQELQGVVDNNSQAIQELQTITAKNTHSIQELQTITAKNNYAIQVNYDAIQMNRVLLSKIDERLQSVEEKIDLIIEDVVVHRSEIDEIKNFVGMPAPA